MGSIRGFCLQFVNGELPRKSRLATSVSTTSLAVAFGGEVRTALLIDEAYVGFGFFGRSRIDVAQQPVEIERACPNEVRRILNRL
jgi:hypothetical protein